MGGRLAGLVATNGRHAILAPIAAALKDLYATFTPEQKAIADQRFGGFGPGWSQGYRGGPRGYSR